MFTASARSIDGTLRHEVDVNGRHAIITDEPERLGGEDSGPAPHELLPAMLAACVSTTLTLYARRHDWPLDGLSVDVVYDPEASPRAVTTTIRLPEALDEQQVAVLRRAADTCPVRRAFEAGFSFEERIVRDAPAIPSAG
jgi:putative redox protein